jgi:hypothetical protein
MSVSCPSSLVAKSGFFSFFDGTAEMNESCQLEMKETLLTLNL